MGTLLFFSRFGAAPAFLAAALLFLVRPSVFFTGAFAFFSRFGPFFGDFAALESALLRFFAMLERGCRRLVCYARYLSSQSQIRDPEGWRENSVADCSPPVKHFFSTALLSLGTNDMRFPRGENDGRTFPCARGKKRKDGHP
jgi:hypothetical protein